MRESSAPFNEHVEEEDPITSGAEVPGDFLKT
jgi:hypothetical protein